MPSENEGSSPKTLPVEVTKYKIVFLGEQGVGKSSIITKFIRNEISEEYLATIGIDFFSKNVVANNETVSLIS
ncbi:GTP-binding protein YPT6 [Toxocara canis]|uniref:GTP-binding protein YPT6 n=1 Tax=Toxocara canis TaxID=6265 RepID=A0A0B2VTZ8_TOXCA|nr:GTP-binding protein YPT6 [Toxocara canis]